MLKICRGSQEMFDCWIKLVAFWLGAALLASPRQTASSTRSQRKLHFSPGSAVQRYVNQFHSVNISLATGAVHVLCTCLLERPGSPSVAPTWPKEIRFSSERAGACLHTNDWRPLTHFLVPPGCTSRSKQRNIPFCSFANKVKGQVKVQNVIIGADMDHTALPGGIFAPIEA